VQETTKANQERFRPVSDRPASRIQIAIAKPARKNSAPSAMKIQPKTCRSLLAALFRAERRICDDKEKSGKSKAKKDDKRWGRVKTAAILSLVAVC
jgi:hypothetical protein